MTAGPLVVEFRLTPRATSLGARYLRLYRFPGGGKGVLLGDQAAGDLPLLADAPDGLEAAVLDARDLLVAEASPDGCLGCCGGGNGAAKLRMAQQHRPERVT